MAELLSENLSRFCTINVVTLGCLRVKYTVYIIHDFISFSENSTKDNDNDVLYDAKSTFGYSKMEGEFLFIEL